MRISLARPRADPGLPSVHSRNPCSESVRGGLLAAGPVTAAVTRSRPQRCPPQREREVFAFLVAQLESQLGLIALFRHRRIKSRHGSNPRDVLRGRGHCCERSSSAPNHGAPMLEGVGAPRSARGLERPLRHRHRPCGACEGHCLVPTVWGRAGLRTGVPLTPTGR